MIYKRYISRNPDVTEEWDGLDLVINKNGLRCFKN